MRNLITGIFTVLAGFFFVGGRQALDDNDGKVKDQIDAVRDSATIHSKSPAPVDIKANK